MNVFSHFRDEVVAVVEDLAGEGALPRGIDTAKVSVEPPRDAAHGDLATNAAMVLAKSAGRKPRELAELLAVRLGAHTSVTEASVAGPGFINLRLDPAFWQKRVRDALEAGTAYGDATLGAGRRVNVEFVSANPTGPMHVGHGRGAVVGDALAALLAKAGFEVTREYYINDAGAQVDALARAVFLRYRESLGETIGEIPEGLYPGDYLVPVGDALARAHGKALAASERAEWLPIVRDAAVGAMMTLIRDDLAALNIRFDVYASERALTDAGRIQQVVDELASRDLVYTGTLEPPKGKQIEDWEPRPQLLFRATQFGDDVDRPLRKSDGSWTYFAADIAYHADKIGRGFDALIDVWGADHGGYVKRMQAAVEALSEGRVALDVKLCQLVHLMERGEPVKMSKRAGTFVTLREVVDRVGRDVVRFIMLTRKNDAPLEFDLAKVMEQSKDNPVFYVQYAHARACSALRNAQAAFPRLGLDDSALAAAELERLIDEGELALVRLMAGWPRIVEAAAEAHEPHRVAFYLYDLAAEFHAQWNRGNDDEALRFIVSGDERLSAARLALVRAVAIVIASGLGVMGVEPVQEMR
jgi:arginyl-tRNA synthetase